MFPVEPVVVVPDGVVTVVVTVVVSTVVVVAVLVVAFVLVVPLVVVVVGVVVVVVVGVVVVVVVVSLVDALPAIADAEKTPSAASAPSASIVKIRFKSSSPFAGRCVGAPRSQSATCLGPHFPGSRDGRQALQVVYNSARPPVGRSRRATRAASNRSSGGYSAHRSADREEHLPRERKQPDDNDRPGNDVGSVHRPETLAAIVPLHPARSLDALPVGDEVAAVLARPAGLRSLRKLQTFGLVHTALLKQASL